MAVWDNRLWKTAQELFFWYAEQSNLDGRSLVEHLTAIANRSAVLEDAWADSPQTATDERAHRADRDSLDRRRLALIRAARLGIIEQLSRGYWRGFGYTHPDSPIAEIPLRYWHFLELDWDRGSAAGQGLSYFGLRFTYESTLEEARTSLPQSAPSNPDASSEGEEPTDRPTAAMEQRCRRLLRELAKSGTKLTRAEAFDLAKKIVGESLPERSFKRAWAAEAPDEWKQPGRRPQRGK